MTRPIFFIGDNADRGGLHLLVDARELGLRRLSMPPEPDLRGPLAVECPRCGAAPGSPCDRRTLGAHLFHQARTEVKHG